MTSRVLTKWIRSAILVGSAGTLWQLGSCSPQGVGHFVMNFNPCGTILACDPVTYEFIRSGYEGPGADPTVDPACTYPPFCADDPFVATPAAG